MHGVGVLTNIHDLSMQEDEQRNLFYFFKVQTLKGVTPKE